MMLHTISTAAAAAAQAGTHRARGAHTAAAGAVAFGITAASHSFCTRSALLLSLVARLEQARPEVHVLLLLVPLLLVPLLPATAAAS
jgi:hypothetical protein